MLDPYLEVFKKANTILPNPNSLQENEALVIMLQVVHWFKNLIDLYYDNIDDSESDCMNKEIEDIINNRTPKFNKGSFKITPGYLSNLLLRVLYSINGKFYRINDPDYAFEEELDKILELPNYSYELDSAITKSILLPIYHETHSDPEEKEDELPF